MGSWTDWFVPSHWTANQWLGGLTLLFFLISLILFGTNGQNAWAFLILSLVLLGCLLYRERTRITAWFRLAPPATATATTTAAATATLFEYENPWA